MFSCVESMCVCVWSALSWSWGHKDEFAPLLSSLLLEVFSLFRLKVCAASLLSDEKVPCDVLP